MSERDYLLAAIERCEKRAKRWVNLCERPGLIPDDIQSRLGWRPGRIKSIKTGVPKRRLARDLTAPCWFPVCPASSASLVCKPTEFPSFLSCRRFSHESELLGSDPSLTIILAKATEETKAMRYQTKPCFVGRAGHLHDYPTKGLLYLDLKIGNLGHGWHLHGPQFQRWERCVVGVLGPQTLFQTV
jgi:hypothetical protein